MLHISRIKQGDKIKSTHRKYPRLGNLNKSETTEEYEVLKVNKKTIIVRDISTRRESRVYFNEDHGWSGQFNFHN